MTTYVIDYSDPLKAGFTIQPGSFDGPGGSVSSSSLRLYGRGSLEWGESVDEDLVRLLENFAGATPPLNPTPGQLWYKQKLYWQNTAAATLVSGAYAPLNAFFRYVTTASFTGTITTVAGGTLTVSSVVPGGVLAVGDIILGSFAATNPVAAGTTILSQSSGTTGGVGVYLVSVSQTVGSTPMTSSVWNATNVALNPFKVMVTSSAISAYSSGVNIGDYVWSIADSSLYRWDSAYKQALVAWLHRAITVSAAGPGITIPEQFLLVRTLSGTFDNPSLSSVVLSGITTAPTAPGGNDFAGTTTNPNPLQIANSQYVANELFISVIPMLTAIPTVGNNTAIGFHALYSNTISGVDNVATGHNALYSNTIGSQNTATGRGTLYYNTTGTDNVATGYGALHYNTTGGNNVATGTWALGANTTGNDNIATGLNALFSNTTGTINVATGTGALHNNTTGYSNIATGLNALYSNTTGVDNIALGAGALATNTIGDLNIALGYQALYNNTTGNYNVALGYSALYSNTVEVGNVALGRGAGQLAVGVNNTLWISNTSTTTPLIYGTFDPTGGSLGTLIFNATTVTVTGGNFVGGITGNATTASNLSGTPLLPTGTTAHTYPIADNNVHVATTAYVDASVVSAAGLGYGQTWHNHVVYPTAGWTRRLGVTYYNNTGKPIMLVLSVVNGYSYNGCVITVGGIAVNYGTGAYNGSSLAGASGPSIIIPPGGTDYTVTGSGVALYYWAELS
jgi:hypothetical protein